MEESLPVIENCDNCGACCMVTAVPPFVKVKGVHEAIVRKVPKDLLNEILPLWEIRFQLPSRHCLWFDSETKGCRHYDFRPQACRDFAVDSQSCHLIREELGIHQDSDAKTSARQA